MSNIREIIKKVIENANNRKSEFRQRYEATYGESFESKCHYNYMYVTKQTKSTEYECHEASAIVTATVFCAGLHPAVQLWESVGLTLFSWGATDFLIKPHTYDQYIVDVGKISNWQRNAETGEWTGMACGEQLVFNIDRDGKLVYQGHVDLSSHNRTFPLDPPCYTYCTTAASKGVYMFDFDWGNLSPIEPLKYANP